MSGSLQVPCTASCSGRPFESSSSSSTSRTAVPPALAAPRRSRRGCRRSSRRYAPAQASAAAFAGDLTSFSSASGGLPYETLQQLTSVLGFLIGAGWFAYQFLQTKVRNCLLRKLPVECCCVHAQASLSVVSLAHEFAEGMCLLLSRVMHLMACKNAQRATAAAQSNVSVQDGLMGMLAAAFVEAQGAWFASTSLLCSPLCLTLSISVVTHPVHPL